MREIGELDQLEDVLNESQNGPVLVLKHSTRCPISAMAHSRVEAYEREIGEGGPPIFLIKVIEARPVSNAIAERLGIEHKSPQAFLVMNGSVRWTASHYDITVDRIREAVSEASALGEGE